MRTRFSSADVWGTYDRNVRRARKALATLPVCNQKEPTVLGLSGWVFEQTVRSMLDRELVNAGLPVPIKEQVSFAGKAKADLAVDRVMIEVKLSGAFGAESFAKYRTYRRRIEDDGGVYLYLSGEESYAPNRALAEKVFGQGNTFFLDPGNEWPRFVERVVRGVSLGRRARA